MTNNCKFCNRELVFSGKTQLLINNILENVNVESCTTCKAPSEIFGNNNARSKYKILVKNISLDIYEEYLIFDDGLSIYNDFIIKKSYIGKYYSGPLYEFSYKEIISFDLLDISMLSIEELLKKLRLYLKLL